MLSSSLTALTVLALLVVLPVKGQTPEFQGALLLQPYLSNNKCLTAASDTNGAVVTIQDCVNSPAQKWTFNPVDKTVRTLNNKCLDVKQGNDTNGAVIQVWNCSNNNANQKWAYNKWDNDLTWFGKGKCLDLPKGNLANGNRLQIWACRKGNVNQIWNVGYSVNSLPAKSQNGQTGTNACGTTSSQDKNCQTAWINSGSDFCLWAPHIVGQVGDRERDSVAWCTKSGRGTRTIPDGTIKGLHFLRTPEYVQITGKGDFTKMNIPAGDDGGELDNRGADGKGNPIGGLLYGNTFGSNLQYHEWTEFISDDEFCIRACVGPRAKQLCNHIYDVLGCSWNMPGNYKAGSFDECLGDSAIPMGVYGTSTFYQGQKPTPPPHPAPRTSSCKSIASPTVGPVAAAKKRSEHAKHGFAKRQLGHHPSFPEATAAPN